MTSAPTHTAEPSGASPTPGAVPFTGHWVSWTIERDWVHGTITCHEPEQAGCRQACAEGCETWDTGHEHRMVSVECLAAEWISAVGEPIAEVYDGPRGERVALRDGPVSVRWDGDGWTWTYTEPRPAAGTASPVAVELLERQRCKEIPAGAYCHAPADVILWGALFPAEALGPRCLEHARRHVDTHDTYLAQSAVLDLRPLRSALSGPPSTASSS